MGMAVAAAVGGEGWRLLSLSEYGWLLCNPFIPPPFTPSHNTPFFLPSRRFILATEAGNTFIANELCNLIYG